MKCKIRIPFQSFRCRYPLFQNHLLKRLFFPLLCILVTLVKSQLTIYASIYFWALYSVPLIYVSALSHCFCAVLISVALWHILKSGRMIPPYSFCPRLFWLYGVFCGYICILAFSFYFCKKKKTDFYELYWICRSFWIVWAF